MEIIAFESGMLHKSPAPILLLEQLEIFLSDKTDCIDAANLAKAWNIGANAASLFENWQWQHDLNLPLEEVRNKYAVITLRRP
jgi:ubiquinone biosynthesis protein Coq4